MSLTRSETQKASMVWSYYTHDSLAKTILQGTVEGGRKRGKLSCEEVCANQLVPLRHKPRADDDDG